MRIVAMLLFLGLSLAANAQKGITYVMDGYHLNRDTTYEKFTGRKVWRHSGEKKVGEKWISDSAWYWEINYDYGEPIPSYWEFVKMYVDGKLTDTIRGWRVELKNKFAMYGWTEGIYSYDIRATNLNKNAMHQHYNTHMSVSYGFSETEDFQISIGDGRPKQKFIPDGSKPLKLKKKK